MHENNNGVTTQCWENIEVTGKKGEGIQFIEVAAVPNVIVPAFA